MTDQRNFILAIVISIAILVGFQYFYERPRLEQQQQQAQQQALLTQKQKPKPAASAAPATAPKSVAQVVAQGQRVTIRTPSVEGSLSTVGARLDDLSLSTYHQTIDPKSPPILLLAPAGTAEPYYAEFGWVPADPKVQVPGETTRWTADGTTLTPSKPVTLTWDNGHGLVFKRVVSIDDNYMFTVVQTVQNTGKDPVVLHPYGLISRHGTPTTQGTYLLHEGPLGVLDGTLHEYDYKSLQNNAPSSLTSTGGWLGITDKYWLVALVPDQKATITARFSEATDNKVDDYQTDYLGKAVTLAPGASTSATSHLFAGAKQVKLLDAYQQQYNIVHFDKAIDFGWFYFLTKPFFYALDYLGHLTGNFGLGIMAFTVFLKALFFPLANRSFRSMSAMKRLQPEVSRLRELYGEDRVRLNQEMMQLYKREKVNPVSGCLPMLLQIPVFFALYKVLYVTIEMRHAPFFGWIHDLSAPDPTTVFNLFGLLPFPASVLPPFLMIGAWPLVMGITMFLQQRLNPAPADPVQQKMFLAMPVVFTVMMSKFPAGLVIYYAWNNSLSILQQLVISRQTRKATRAAKAAG